MVLILSCFLGACWYFPTNVAGEWEYPSLVHFDHFSSASVVEISIPLSTSSFCPFALHKEIQTEAISNSRVKRFNRPSRPEIDPHLEFLKLSPADEAIIMKLP